MRLWADSRLSTVGLLVGNAVPLAGVVALDWSVAVLLVVCWLESAVVGASFVARILRARGDDDPDELPNTRSNDRSMRSFVGEPNRSVTLLFASHYGTFWLVHGVFVAGLSGIGEAGLLELRAIALSVLGLGGYHAASYWLHVVAGDEASRRGPATLMVEPYRRVFLLHVTVVLGLFGALALGSPAGLVAVMVPAKTALDLRGHWREHDRNRDAPGSHSAS